MLIHYTQIEYQRGKCVREINQDGEMCLMSSVDHSLIEVRVEHSMILLHQEIAHLP